jgi:two-component system, NarL family, sensor kinase
MRRRLRTPEGGRSPVREAMIRYVAIGLAAIALISVVGVWLFHRAGDAEAIRDAKDQTRIAAEGSVEPVLSDALLRENPRALAALDRVVQERVLSRPDDAIARVKIWDSSGRIVYSDEPALIGKRYALSAQDRADFKSGRVEAEVSDLSKPENRFEQGMGRLLEVYLPIRTPSGVPLRYETYYRSSFISARAGRIFRQFAPLMIGALILLALIQLPLAWWLAQRIQHGQDEREQLLRRAIDASDVERRRIAQDLHDGVVQDLAAVSYSLAAAAEDAPAPYDRDLRTAAAETRHGIGQLRTLLVDIYPPELHRAGLAASLADVLGSAEARGLETSLDVDPDLRLEPETEALFFRIAQESVRNAVKHAAADSVSVQVVATQMGAARLVVEDDGRGFDPQAAETEGHFGLRLLDGLARDAGGELEIDSASGAGTRVTAEVPT